MKNRGCLLCGSILDTLHFEALELVVALQTRESQTDVIVWRWGMSLVLTTGSVHEDSGLDHQYKSNRTAHPMLST